jgi:hypothetical protein
MQPPKKTSPDKEILKTFEAAGLVEYLEYLQSGKRIMLTNFKAGIAKGLGLTLGMTVVLGLVAWILTLLVNLPIIGEYAQKAEDYMIEYRESTNYTDEFREMTDLLQQINDNSELTDSAVNEAGDSGQNPEADRLPD